jgi:hypothetical protein
MEPLGPILVVRAAALDESSPSDFARVDETQNTAPASALSLGQFVRATIVSSFEHAALARIGQSLVQLQFEDLPPAGSELELQVIATVPALQFRMLQSQDDIPAALDVALSPDLPQLMAAQANPLSPAGARHAPAAWPDDAPAGVPPDISNEQLVSLFEQAVRELLSAAQPASAAAGSALSTIDNQSLHASPQAVLTQTTSNPQATPDARFVAYVGWAWPEQAIEVEVDQRGQNGATDEFMKTCVISLRLLLPRSGRLQSVLSWSTPGLRVAIESASEDTANALRHTSGLFLDALASQQVRVSGLSIRHE